MVIGIMRRPRSRRVELGEQRSSSGGKTALVTAGPRSGIAALRLRGRLTVAPACRSADQPSLSGAVRGVLLPENVRNLRC
jgi:hypothetical protein